MDILRFKTNPETGISTIYSTFEIVIIKNHLALIIISIRVFINTTHTESGTDYVSSGSPVKRLIG